MAWTRPTKPSEDEAPTAQIRAIHALEQARKHRHHQACMCRNFNRANGGFCNATDELWQNALNRELDLIPRNNDTN